MKIYKLNKGFIFQTLDKKMVIFDGEKSVLYTLNETATVIFQKIKSGFDKKTIVQQLVKNYGIDANNAQKDLNALLNDLLIKKIITQKTQ